MTEAREPGFYWVKVKPLDEWSVVEWTDDFGGIWCHDDLAPDRDPAVIGPRIEPPKEPR